MHSAEVLARVRLSRVESLASSGLGLDTETHLIAAGLLAPPIVCASAAWLEAGPMIAGILLGKHDAIIAFAQALDDSNVILVFANAPFDLAVVAVELAKMGIDAMPSIFNAFAEHRVYDIMTGEILNAVAGGHLGKDPRTGQKIINPETKRPGRYSLSTIVYHVLGRQDAKANDEWRLRYFELENIPIEQWPPAARDYPVDDAKNTFETALAQTGHMPKIGYRHEWGPSNGGSACLECGSTRFAGLCLRRARHLNLIDHANQIESWWALHLGAAWGFHVDQATVDTVEKHAIAKRAAGIPPFMAAGIFRENGKENRSVLKRMIAVAYGAGNPCDHCNGTGKIPSPAAKPIQCPDCRGRCVPWKCAGKIRDPEVAACARCANTGKIPHPKPSQINCVGDAGEKTCDGSGLYLTSSVPRAKKGGIATSRDCLHESGDEFMMALGDFKVDEKILKDYIPYLRHGRVTDASGTHHDVALILRPNPMLETGRSSYEGYIQLFPRKSGYIDRKTKQYVPSLRECIQARGHRYEVVEVPDDYVLAPGEEVVVELAAATAVTPEEIAALIISAARAQDELQDVEEDEEGGTE